jgi:uncharacterized protein YkwD
VRRKRIMRQVMAHRDTICRWWHAAARSLVDVEPMASLPDLPQTEIAIVEMTNAFRRESKLAEVKPNAALTAAARAFAQYLAKTGQFAHEAGGHGPGERVVASGYHYCQVAENLAMNLDSRGFATRALARAVVEGWKGSPPHRANLLKASATEIGVGLARAPDLDPKFISVQLFGRPQSLKVEFRIENQAGTPVRYVLGEEVHTLPSRTIVTHASCDADRLTFENVGQATQRFEPRDGDRFVVRSRAGGGIAIEPARR